MELGLHGRDFSKVLGSWDDFNIQCLKGLSYEIDFKNFDKNLQN
jgi:hypothetical protein